MNLDFLEIMGNACATLIGRILTTLAIITLGAGLGVFFGSPGEGRLAESLLFGFPILILSVLTVSGFILLPILLGFTVLFSRFEWHWGLLSIPAILAFYLTFSTVSP